MELGRDNPERFKLGFEVIEYERGNLGFDDFVLIKSNGIYFEPAVNDTYQVGDELIINTNSAKLTINIPGNSKLVVRCYYIYEVSGLTTFFLIWMYKCVERSKNIYLIFP